MLLWLALTALPPLACAGPGLHGAARTASEARYVEALAALTPLEAQLPRRSPRWCARYALERALVHLALGDLVAADYWLRVTWHLVDREPDLLPTRDRARLILAWRSTGRLPGER